MFILWKVVEDRPDGYLRKDWAVIRHRDDRSRIQNDQAGVL